ncbi:MAG: hypothetical protein ACXAC2_18250 [Candidatus Kariarchaeaceae archaeon]|jgi:ABC-type transport system involved in multi-copper enzyme maturation permease subunit
MIEQESNSDEYLQRFGYRSYEGITTSRFRRILSIIEFEVKSTWHKSTFGKVLLVIVSIFNFFTIIFAATLSEFAGISNEDALNEFVANYIAFGDGEISSNTNDQISVFDPGIIGILLISLFAIAGSGYFADDKNGKVVEIYLSRLAKREYIIGKIGGILIYINIFLLGPLLVTSIIMIQSLEVHHLDYLGFYFEVVLFSFAYSVIIGLASLPLSSLVYKRQYASLGFFVIFLLGSIMGSIVIDNNRDNEFLLLISPSIFLMLLAYVILGDTTLAIRDFEGGDDEFFITKTPLDLNDGAGLEYWHVLLQALAFILIFSLILWYKIRKLTTEEL